MKVIMTCGGTGGHIYPALSIADKIKENNPDAEIMFIGTLKGMENDIVPAHGYPIRSIPASGFKRKQIWKNFQTLKDTLEGYNKAKAIIKRFDPDLVMGTGGYVCGPVVRAAHKLGYKTAIHEQNAFPGMTNKILSKYVDKVFLSFEEAEKYFKREGGMYLAGNPLRNAVIANRKDEARENLGIAKDAMMILSFGGSLGAPRINSLLMSAIEKFKNDSRVEIFFVTGKRQYSDIKEKLAQSGADSADNVKVFEYINNMPEYMAAADIVISRAGALTIAELTASGKPAILIPSPYVTGNHQFFNAKVMSDKGAAVLVEEKELDDSKVIEILEKMRDDRSMLDEMSAVSLSLAKNDAADIIYEELKEYLVKQA